MAKLHRPVAGLRMFFCPGCQEAHGISVQELGNTYPNPWEWNGSEDRPTFSPSILANGSTPEKRCHSFVKDGMIQFLDDCWHALKGHTVEIPEWDRPLRERDQS